MPNPLLLILVVEDEYLVQELAQGALSDGGFDTKTVSSGEEAVGLLDRDHARYCALLADIHLSGDLTGWDVARRARQS